MAGLGAERATRHGCRGAGRRRGAQQVRRQLGSRALGYWAARARAAGGTSWASKGARSLAEAQANARGARLGAQPGRAADNGLCTRCTQPVFGSV